MRIWIVLEREPDYDNADNIVVHGAFDSEAAAEKKASEVLGWVVETTLEPDELKGELIGERRRIVEFLASIQPRIDACADHEPVE